MIRSPRRGAHLWACAFALLAGTACSSEEEEPPPPAITTDAVQCRTSTTNPVLQSCDLSCLYDNPDYPLQTGVTYHVAGPVLDFFDPTRAVEGAIVKAWLDDGFDRPPDGVSTPTDAQGVYTLSFDNARGNVRGTFMVSHPSGDYLETYQSHVLIVAADTNEAVRIAVRELSTDIVLGLFETTRDPNRGLIAGIVQDCVGRTLAHGVVRIYEAPHTCGRGGTPLDTSVGYFDGSDFPDPSQRVLNKDGSWLAINTKPTDLVVEAWGSLEPDQQASLLACGRLRVVAGAISLLALEPYPVPVP